MRLTWKPAGVTSAALVREVQGQLEASPGKAWKVCHGGALDPFASGLLPILIGPATKLFELIHELPKTYRTTVEWGRETDTGDPGGVTSLQGDSHTLSPDQPDSIGAGPDQLELTLRSFVGWTKQVPPATSNKRIEGERAYVRAHRGEVVELPPVDVYLHEAKWVSHELPLRSELELTCRGGFYVRSLARELGRTLGCGAHLGALTRTTIGPWSLPSTSEPITLDAVEAFSWLPTVVLRDDEWARVKTGSGAVSLRAKVKPARWSWPPTFPSPSSLVIALHQDRGVALLKVADQGFAIDRVILPPL